MKTSIKINQIDHLPKGDCPPNASVDTQRNTIEFVSLSLCPSEASHKKIPAKA